MFRSAMGKASKASMGFECPEACYAYENTGFSSFRLRSFECFLYRIVNRVEIYKGYCDCREFENTRSPKPFRPQHSPHSVKSRLPLGLRVFGLLEAFSGLEASQRVALARIATKFPRLVCASFLRERTLNERPKPGDSVTWQTEPSNRKQAT